MRAYVVDDDPLVLRTIMEMLDGEGVEPEAFASATAFLAALDTLPFGCVLLDIGMPDLNGHEVLREVIARRPFPVVMVSGSVDMNDAIRSFRGGAVHFIRKPFRQSALLTTLAEAWQIGLERKAAAERREEATRISLTPREQEVLGAMTEGHQTKSIAWKLGLSVRTVEMHRAKIMSKLRARNATQAVAIARTLQLTPGAPVGV